VLEARSELLVLARDHRRRGKPCRDLLRVVGAGQDGDRTGLDDAREAPAGHGVESLHEAEDGRFTRRKRGHDLPEGAARHGHDDELRLREGRLADRARGDPGEIEVAHVAWIASGRLDRRGLLRVTAGEDDVVPAQREEGRERRAPRAPADDDGVH
jgi:hypothetical protein